MTVAELLQRMSSRELAQWQVYASQEPLGDARADLRAGSICATLVNLQRKPGTRPYTPGDMSLRFRTGARRVASTDKVAAVMRMLRKPTTEQADSTVITATVGPAAPDKPVGTTGAPGRDSGPYSGREGG